MFPRAAWARPTAGFLSPIDSAAGLAIAVIGFVMAVAQPLRGASQPIFGAVADKHGPPSALAPARG